MILTAEVSLPKLIVDVSEQGQFLNAASPEVSFDVNMFIAEQLLMSFCKERGVKLEALTRQDLEELAGLVVGQLKALAKLDTAEDVAVKVIADFLEASRAELDMETFHG